MGWAASAFISAFTLLFGWVFNLIALISAALLQGVSQIFNWVISENFISLSYTDPARNPFIAVGWDLTRGLANIFFVLALVAIGLGTALRMQDYQAKKKLPMLIIMALLINFTPVILGLIVDGSNLIMNFFLQGVTGTDVFTSNIITIGNNFKGAATIWDPQMAMSSTINSITISIFNFITTFILFLFCVLFIMRYVMIWVLVILSPLAFASYVFPQTRREFSEWWKNFIQWVTIGVTGTFFLYLGSQIMYLSGTESFKNQLSSIPGGGGATDFSMLFNSLLPYGIAMVIMSVGLTKSLSSGNAASSAITGFMEKQGKAFLGRASQGFRNQARNRAGSFLRGKVPERIKKWGEKQSMRQTWGAGETGFKGFAKRTAGGLVGTGWRSLGAAVGPEIKQATNRLISESEKLGTGKTWQENVRAFQGASTTEERVGRLNAIIKDGKINDVLKDGSVTLEQISQTYNQVKGTGGEKTLERSMLHIIPEEKLGEVIGKMEAEDISRIAGDAIKNETVRNAIIENLKQEEIPALFKRKDRNIMWEEYSRRKPEEFLEKGPNGERTLRWFAGSAAASLGLGPIGGWDPNRIEQEKKRMITEIAKKLWIAKGSPQNQTQEAQNKDYENAEKEWRQRSKTKEKEIEINFEHLLNLTKDAENSLNKSRYNPSFDQRENVIKKLEELDGKVAKLYAQGKYTQEEMKKFDPARAQLKIQKELQEVVKMTRDRYSSEINTTLGNLRESLKRELNMNDKDIEKNISRFKKEADKIQKIK